MWIEAGCLPNRHGAAASFKGTKKQSKGTPTQAREAERVCFTLNSSMAPNYAPQFHRSYLKSVDGSGREENFHSSYAFLQELRLRER